MSKHDTNSRQNGPTQEEELEELFEVAGRRSPVPEEDLAAIKQAARVEWEHLVEMVEGKDETPRSPGSYVTYLPLAAALVIAAGIAWLWIGRTAPLATVEYVTGSVVVQAGEGTAPTALLRGASVGPGSELSTLGDGGATSRVALRLGSGVAHGGLSLRIDTDSRLRLISSETVELLAGTVYIDSGSEGTDRSLIRVQTPIGVARDIGTQFEVSLLSDRGTDADAGVALRVRVRVREGTVEIEQGGSRATAYHGDELLLSANGSLTRSRLTPFADEWQWILEAAPALELEGQTVREVLEWVARETGLAIHYATPRIEALVGTTTVSGGAKQPHAALEVALQSAELSGERSEGTLVISDRLTLPPP